MHDAGSERDGVAERVRQLVAERLGVGPEMLASHASLRDDLAADSLDLLEVSVALEDDLGVTLPERMLDDVRTVGELVAATVAIARTRGAALGLLEPVRLRARIAGPDGQHRVLERSDVLTPYALEAVAEDARYAGRGARVDVTLGADAPTSALDSVRAALDSLAARGVTVTVQRDGAAPVVDRVGRRAGRR